MTCGPALADGPRATASGGSATVGNLSQQNISQGGRQNNNCTTANALTGGRLLGRCVTADGSLNKYDIVHTGPAHASGGSGTVVLEQAIAQRGRQNNNCAMANDVLILGSGGELRERCVNLDGSLNKHTVSKGGGARAEGGSNIAALNQQTAAQAGRQNNNCANPNNTGFALDGGEGRGWCVNKDGSRSKQAITKNGSARAESDASTDILGANQQDTAQEGRQNNSCANPNFSSLNSVAGEVNGRCVNLDRSRDKHTVTEGAGVRATSGSGNGLLRRQGTAQEGRQNNHCVNLNNTTVIPQGDQARERCVNLDGSLNKHTVTKGGGARAEGGSSTSGGATQVNQVNTAQEGRQNNNCTNPNFSLLRPNGGKRECVNLDGSLNKHTVSKGGGARAEGGSSTGLGLANQRNTAQEGRQNNNCANPNDTEDLLGGGGGKVTERCVNLDGSLNKHTVTRGGGARAEGGSSTSGITAQMDQVNTAQEGRQNNNCADPNSLDSTLSGSRVENLCKTVDRSKNAGTAEERGAAEAEGGSSAGQLFQQNTAQNGRQNNNCSNPNNLTLTAMGSRTQTRCIAVDHSTNIGTSDK
ncbi:hypothetical protein [Streptomyces sp. NPDC051776]|uniref:hypothetical protein n=1 Tax=Streptomyces sp. NPDC051776 TaxID=3155414 RepID=UPI00342B61BF